MPIALNKVHLPAGDMLALLIAAGIVESGASLPILAPSAPITALERRFTSKLTVSPLSLNTCTAVAYSTFSSDMPFADIMRSFTLEIREKY